MDPNARIRFAKVLAAAWLGAGGSLAAMTVEVEQRNLADRAIEAPVTVYLTGLIDADTPQKVQRAVSGLKEEWISVVVDSPGGNLYAGMELGRVLRRYATTTTIGTRGQKYKPDKGACFSACALAFLGGSYRYMAPGSVYGVHRASRLGAASAADLDMGQVISANIAAYYRDMGVDSALLDLSVKTGRDSMYMLSPQQLKELRVVNNGRKSPEWTIEVVQGGTYLKGVQETLYGTGKALFLCAGGNASFMSFYTAADKAASIAAGGWTHSAMLDEVVIPLASPARIEAKDGEVQALFPALPRSVMNQLQTATSVGHTMQVTRDAPTFVGYRVEVDHRNRERVSTYAGNCLGGR